MEGEISDPRFLITGYMKDGVLQRGLFDEDSWHETMSKWATTVVSGRAKLGGYPVGIICVETRTQVTASASSVLLPSHKRCPRRRRLHQEAKRPVG